VIDGKITFRKGVRPDFNDAGVRMRRRYDPGRTDADPADSSDVEAEPRFLLMIFFVEGL
jgi:hypothetical protein